MDKELIQKLGIAERLELYRLEKEYIGKMKTTVPVEIRDDDSYYTLFLFPERWYSWDNDAKKIDVLKDAIQKNMNIKNFFEIPVGNIKK